jgi:hypothetical protein
VRIVDWIYQWAAGLTVTGEIHDIVQNVLQSAFETEVGGSRVTATVGCLSLLSVGPLLEVR